MFQANTWTSAAGLMVILIIWKKNDPWNQNQNILLFQENTSEFVIC